MNRYPVRYKPRVVWVSAILVALGMLIVSCSPAASPIPTQALTEHIRANSLDTSELRILIDRPIQKGRLFVYTFRADQGGSVWDGLGYAIAEQRLMDGWTIRESGSSLREHSPSLIAYTSEQVNQADTLIFGRTFAPNITSVKVTLNTGVTIQEQVQHGVFAILVDQNVRIKQVQVLGANDVLLKQYDLPHLLEAADE